MPAATLTTPLAYVDVYVNDIIELAQTEWAKTIMRWLAMHNINCIFQPNMPPNHVDHKQPISVSKLGKGDAAGATTKTILSWDVNTCCNTIELPIHHTQHLTMILVDTLTKCQGSWKGWHCLLGELHSMVMGIKGGARLFSHLQDVLVCLPTVRCFRVTQNLQDWQHLATSLAE